MTAARLKRLQEMARAKGKELFLESFTVDSSNISIEHFDKDHLVESYNDTEYRARAILRNIPISIYDVNRNGRRYPRELFQNLIRKGMFNRAHCMANHAGSGKDGEHGPADVLKICGVWHNLRADKDYPRADLYLVGEAGQLMLEALEAGSKAIHFSINGFGELLDDGVTVNPETYESADEESACDWVTTPSAGPVVRATKEENLYFSFNDSESMQEKTNIKVVQAIEQPAIMENSKMSEEIKSVESESVKLQERHLKHQVELTVREAYKSENIPDALEELSSVEKLIADRPALQDTYNKVIRAQAELKEKLEKEMAAKEQKITEAQQSIESVTKENNELKESLKKIESKYKTATKVVENLQKQIKFAKKFKESVKGKVLIPREVYRDMLTDNTVFREERKQFLATIKKLKEEAGEEWEEPEDGMPYFDKDMADTFDVEEDEDFEEMDNTDEVAFVEEDEDFPVEDEFEESEEEDEFEESEEEDEFEESEEDEFTDEDEMMEHEDFTNEDEMMDDEEMYSDDEDDLYESDEEVEDVIPYSMDDDEFEEDEEYEDEQIVESTRRRLALLAKRVEANARSRRRVTETKKPKRYVKRVNEKARSFNGDVLRFYLEAAKVNGSIRNIRESILSSGSIAEAYRLVNDYVNAKETKKNLSIKEKVEQHRLIKPGAMW